MSARSLRRDLRSMLALAIPVVLAELGWLFMNVVDTMMVGRLGPQAIGSVSIGSILFDAVGVFGFGLLLGLDTFVSQAFGARRIDECNRWLGQGLYLATFITPPIVAIVVLAIPLMYTWGLQPAVLEGAIPYIHTMLWSLWPVLVYSALRRYLQGMSLVRPVMFALITANLVNASGNWLFIYGNWGMPALGVTGAGWATFWARVYMAASLAAYIVWREWKQPTGLLTILPTPDWSRLRALLRLGLPAAAQISIEVGIFGVATAFAGMLDTLSLAAHHIALNMAGLTFMVPLGISSAGAVSVGQAIGRKDAAGARRAGWVAIGLGVTFMACAGAAFVLIPERIVRMFTADAALIRQAVVLLGIAAVFQLFDGTQVVATGVLRGLGDTKTPAMANLVGHWILGLPVSYSLCFLAGWRAAGIWTGLSAGLIFVGAVLLHAWMRRSNRIVVEPRP